MTPVLDQAAVFAVALMIPVGVYFCGLFVAFMAHGLFAKNGQPPALGAWTKAWLIFCGVYAASLGLSFLSDSPHVQVVAMVAPYWLAFFGGSYVWWKKSALYRHIIDTRLGAQASILRRIFYFWCIGFAATFTSFAVLLPLAWLLTAVKLFFWTASLPL